MEKSAKDHLQKKVQPSLSPIVILKRRPSFLDCEKLPGPSSSNKFDFKPRNICNDNNNVTRLQVIGLISCQEKDVQSGLGFNSCQEGSSNANIQPIIDGSNENVHATSKSLSKMLLLKQTIDRSQVVSENPEYSEIRKKKVAWPNKAGCSEVPTKSK